VLVPYCTCVVAASLVVQVTVALELVALLEDTPEMMGGVVSAAVVVNVRSPDTARLSAASRLSTRK